MKKLTRFIFTPDIHIGKEKAHVGGQLVIRPTHALDAIRVMFDFARDFKPHCWLLGGDQINFGPVSHWHHGKPRLTEGFRVKNEYELFQDIVMAPIESIMAKSGIVRPMKIWHKGNHEQWLDDELDNNPAFEGLVEAESFLGLHKNGWEIKDYGEVSSVGKVHFVHGDVALRRGGGVCPARTLVTQYHRNIRAGHVHTYSAYTLQTAVDMQDYHSGITVPSLSSRAPEYVTNAPNYFINGFLYGLVWDGGFCDNVMIINRGVCAWNDKLYTGK